MLTVTREDHGTEHSGKFAAYVRVSKDDQDVANQEHSIKAERNNGHLFYQPYEPETVGDIALLRARGCTRQHQASGR